MIYSAATGKVSFCNPITKKYSAWMDKDQADKILKRQYTRRMKIMKQAVALLPHAKPSEIVLLTNLVQAEKINL